MIYLGEFNRKCCWGTSLVHIYGSNQKPAGVKAKFSVKDLPQRFVFADGTVCFEQAGRSDWPVAHSILGESSGSVPISGRCGSTEGGWAVRTRMLYHSFSFFSCTLCWTTAAFINSLLLWTFCRRLPPTWNFVFLDEKREKDDRLRTSVEQTVPSQSHPFPARMVFNRRVTELSHFQDVRHIEFDITGSNIE